MIVFRFNIDLTGIFSQCRKLAPADVFSGVGGVSSSIPQPQKRVTAELVHDDEDMLALKEYGYTDYDREHRLVVLTDDGIHQLLSAFNGMKRRVRQLEEERRVCVPLRFIAKRMESALRRDPKGAKDLFIHVEDMMAAWSEAQGGAGNEVLDAMDKTYCEVIAAEHEREERQWLLKQKGQQVAVNGDYNDKSITHEKHMHDN